MNDLISILRDFGFPVFVAVYLMLYNSKLTKENTNATIKMQESIDRLIIELRKHSTDIYRKD